MAKKEGIERYMAKSKDENYVEVISPKRIAVVSSLVLIAVFIIAVLFFGPNASTGNTETNSTNEFTDISKITDLEVCKQQSINLERQSANLESNLREIGTSYQQILDENYNLTQEKDTVEQQIEDCGRSMSLINSNLASARVSYASCLIDKQDFIDATGLCISRLSNILNETITLNGILNRTLQNQTIVINGTTQDLQGQISNLTNLYNNLTSTFGSLTLNFARTACCNTTPTTIPNMTINYSVQNNNIVCNNGTLQVTC